MNFPEVYIILVNYNGACDTIKCLSSLFKCSYPNYKILIVDNASEDDSVIKISNWLNFMEINYHIFDAQDESFIIDQPVVIIKSKVNLGFGGANNIGIKIALRQKIPFVLLLNNDTEVEPHFLSHMVNTMQSYNNVGIVGGKIYYMSDRRKVWYCGGWIDFIKGTAYHIEDEKEGIIETDLVTGCLALLNLKAIKQVGVFDERFFLNVEDWDLSIRMRKAGWWLFINTNAVVYHKISASIGGPSSLRNQYYFHRNRLLFFLKHLNKITLVLFFIFQAFVVIPGWMVKQLFYRNLIGIKAFILGSLDFLRGRFGKSLWV